MALQFYLVALFEAQCLGPVGAKEVRSHRKLVEIQPRIGWIDLVATKTGRTRNLRLMQLKRALDKLAREQLVRLAQPHGYGRFKKFELLNEQGYAESNGAFVPYIIPSGGARPAQGRQQPFGLTEDWFQEFLLHSGQVRVPLEFFTHGWVHSLSNSEIVLFLILLKMAEDWPYQHADEGVFLHRGLKRQYSLTKDVYETYSSLVSFGLVQKIENSNRRPNGEVYAFKGVRNPLEPHRLRVLPSNLRRRGPDIVREATARPARTSHSDGS